MQFSLLLAELIDFISCFRKTYILFQTLLVCADDGQIEAEINVTEPG